MNSLLTERLKPIVMAVPVNTTGAAVTGDYVNLKYYRRLMIVISQGAWAGGTPAVTLKQAQDASATGEKALSFNCYYSTTGLTSDTYTRTAVTGDTFNLTATANTVTVLELIDTDLDLNNGFTHVRLNIASPGANADMICVLGLLGDPDHECLLPNSLSVIA